MFQVITISVINIAATWNLNTQYMLTWNISLILNKTNCWIYTKIPEHREKAIYLIGIPIPKEEFTPELWMGLARRYR